MSNYHIPVMPNESIKLLNVQEGKWYVDCNLGGGGHTGEILKAGAKVLGIDLDPDAIYEVAKNHSIEVQKDETGKLFAKSEKLILVQSNFIELEGIVSRFLGAKVAGVFFDLGVSSFQLEEPSRGFSFNFENAPLDMRMDKASMVKAEDLVNALHEGELSDLFYKLGEENFSRPIARKIVEYRKNKKIETADELAKIILSVRPRTPSDRTHPATRVFQALRIAVNDELNSLREALPAALDVLEKDGRLVVISFHSLEDRIVKNFFKELDELGKAAILTKKPLEPTQEEVNENPRSRSGKLRGVQKL